MTIGKGLRFASLVALCIWLVYRINHLDDQAQVADQSSQLKFSKEHAILGRKVYLGRLTQRPGSGVQNVIFSDTTGNMLAKFQEEKSNKYLMGEGSTADSTDDQRHLQVQQNDLHGDSDSKHRRAGDDHRGLVFDDENGVPMGLIDLGKPEDSTN